MENSKKWLYNGQRTIKKMIGEREKSCISQTITEDRCIEKYFVFNKKGEPMVILFEILKRNPDSSEVFCFAPIDTF